MKEKYKLSPHRQGLSAVQRKWMNISYLVVSGRGLSWQLYYYLGRREKDCVCDHGCMEQLHLQWHSSNIIVIIFPFCQQLEITSGKSVTTIIRHICVAPIGKCVFQSMRPYPQMFIKSAFTPGQSGGLSPIGWGMPRNVAPSYGLVRFYSSGLNRLDNVTQLQFVWGVIA